jgi:hypothetical protein
VALRGEGGEEKGMALRGEGEENAGRFMAKREEKRTVTRRQRNGLRIAMPSMT